MYLIIIISVFCSRSFSENLLQQASSVLDKIGVPPEFQVRFAELNEKLKVSAYDISVLLNKHTSNVKINIISTIISLQFTFA